METEGRRKSRIRCRFRWPAIWACAESYDLPLAAVAKTLPTRAEVDKRFTWNAESVFPDAAAWESAVESVIARLPDLAEFKGHLGDSPDTLADWFEASERVQRLLGKLTVYATMSYSVDVTDQEAVARTDRTRTATARLGAAMSFALPEMIAIGFPKLRNWVATSPRLAHLGHYFDRLEGLQSHVRAPEVEEVLTQVSDPLASAISAHSVLANADMKFPPAVGAGGTEEVAQCTIFTGVPRSHTPAISSISRVFRDMQPSVQFCRASIAPSTICTLYKSRAASWLTKPSSTSASTFAVSRVAGSS